MCYSVEVEKELLKIRMRFNCELSVEEELKFKDLQNLGSDPAWVKEFLKLKKVSKSNPFKTSDPDGRIYPNYFGYVIKGKQRSLVPMRYRIRPFGSREEIPAKYNVFNARVDSLILRDTWRPLFGRQHGIFPFKKFYEWVEVEGKKKLISFHSDLHETLWAPCLYDYWENPQMGLGLYSFALITDDPPVEIMRMGHDRCPIFLREDMIDEWLSPVGKSQKDLFEILKNRENVYYQFAWAV